MGEVVEGNTADVLGTEGEAGILSPAQIAEVTQGVPEKFRNEDGSLNQDALLKSYLELESNRGKPKATEAAPVEDAPAEDTTEEQVSAKGESVEEAPEGDVNEQAKDALNKNGIDPAVISKDFYENGEKLSDEWYAKLADVGYPKEMVDVYVQGLQAQNAAAREQGSAVVQEVYGITGDESTFKQMMDYFSTRGGTANADRYNEALQSEDIPALKAAVADMYVEYRAAEGVEPVRKVGAADAGTNVGVYRSFAEMKEDMRSPRYARDAQFRKDVEARALRSKF